LGRIFFNLQLLFGAMRLSKKKCRALRFAAVGCFILLLQSYKMYIQYRNKIMTFDILTNALFSIQNTQFTSRLAVFLKLWASDVVETRPHTESAVRSKSCF